MPAPNRPVGPFGARAGERIHAPLSRWVVRGVPCGIGCSVVMKRLLLAFGALWLALFAGGVWWLADHARPRHDLFVERRGHSVEAEPGAPLEEPGGFTSQFVRLRADSGLMVDARVLRPGSQDGPLPVVVLLGGYRTGHDAVDVIGHPGSMVIAALDYPYRGDLAMGSAREISSTLREVQQALLDTPPAISVVLDWLQTQPWADVGSAELIGISFGTPFVAVAGALDERFQRVWIIHGGAGNRGWIEHNLQQRVPRDWARPLVASLVHLLSYGNSFDTGDWVSRIAPRPVVIIGARDDARLPEHKVEKLYGKAKPPKELLWTQGGHIGPRRHDLVQLLLDIVRERLAEPLPSAPLLEDGP